MSDRLALAVGAPAPTSLTPPRDLADRVDDAEYARLLGYPNRRALRGPAADAASRARVEFRRTASPWVLSRALAITALGAGEIELEGGGSLSSHLLARRLRRAGADAVVIALVSAGREADERSAALWSEKRPDEAYFADRFAAAVVERLAAWAGDRLRRELRRSGRGLMASYAPGYPGWDLTQMNRVGGCLAGEEGDDRFEILASGMIRPTSSMMAVFGVTDDLEAADRSWERSGCRWCALTRCQFRR